MNLDAFAMKFHDELERFREHWLRMHAESRETWPLNQAEGDWFEHFMSHIGSDEAKR
jgi:hypothetical protein